MPFSTAEALIVNINWNVTATNQTTTVYCLSAQFHDSAIVNSFEYKFCVRYAYFIYSTSGLLYVWRLTYTASVGLKRNFELQILKSTYMLDCLEYCNL